MLMYATFRRDSESNVHERQKQLCPPERQLPLHSLSTSAFWCLLRFGISLFHS